MAQDSLKGIFFDLGGTLTTAYPSVTEHIAQTLADLGHPLPHRDVASAAASLSLRFERPQEPRMVAQS